MNNKLALVFMTLITLSVQAQGDLVLDGARWEAATQGYNCGAFTPSSEAPLEFQDFEVSFDKLVTDKTLDNGLVTATFVEDGVNCRYSAMLLADNAASTIKFVESKAYAPNLGSECLNGKAMLDESLLDNDYLYWGHPHHVTIMLPSNTASSVCGEGATHVGLDFVVSKFLGKR